MYKFKFIDIEEYDDSYVNSPVYTKSYLSFLKCWRKLSPVIVRISYNDKLRGYLLGVSKTLFGVRMFGSPLPGCLLPYIGYYMEDNDIDYVTLLKDSFLFLRKTFNYVSICDIKFSEEMINNLDFNIKSKEKKSTFILDIDRSLDDVKKGFSKTYRNYINYFEKHDGVIKEDYSNEFLEIHNAQLRDVFKRDNINSPNIISKYQLMIDNCQSRGMLYFLKAGRPSKQNISSSIFLYYGKMAFFLSNASYTENLKDRANQSLMWTAIKFFHNKGVKKIDLVGPGEYKKYYGGEPIVFYNIIDGNKLLIAFMRMLKRAYLFKLTRVKM